MSNAIVLYYVNSCYTKRIDAPLEECNLVRRRGRIVNARQANAESITSCSLKVLGRLCLRPFGYGHEVHCVVNEDPCMHGSRSKNQNQISKVYAMYQLACRCYRVL